MTINKKIIAILITVCILLIILASNCLVLYNKAKKQLAIEHSKIVEDSLQQVRLCDMNKTLMISYGLSKWEAHYYSIMFNDFSKSYHIPWEIYPAVIRIESNFKSNIVSNCDAKGITQILESTAKKVANEIGIDYNEKETLWNSYINMIIGMTYLSERIQSSNIEDGIKQYLGGPDYKKTIKCNDTTAKYIRDYKTTVFQEYQKLHYMFIGISHDTVAINVDLFKK
jgi:Transglycosylase SLT domain